MSFALFIAYILFTYLRPFETIAVDLAPYRPMLILWALALVAAGVRALERREVAASPVHFLLLGTLVISIALSQVANQWSGGALVAVADFSPAAMVMVLCLLNLTSIRRLQLTCVVIALSVVVLAGLSVYSFHTGFMADELVLRQSAGASFDIYRDLRDAASPEDGGSDVLRRVRGLGFLNDPNDFAQTMVMVLPLLWWSYTSGRAIRNLVVVVAPGALLGYAIYLTQSRGALVGLASLALVVAHRALGWLMTLLLAAVVVAAIGVMTFGGRELSITEQSAGERVEAWQEGLTMLRSKPVLGVGYGNFTDHHIRTAHNSFVLAFAELGLIGYFAWMGLIVLTYKGLEQALRMAPPNGAERRLALALKASLIAFLTCAWFLSRTYSPGLFILLALCVASWSGVRRSQNPALGSLRQQPPRWRLSTLLAVFVSIVLVYAFVVLQRESG